MIYEQEDTLRIDGYSLHMKVHKITKDRDDRLERLVKLPNRGELNVRYVLFFEYTQSIFKGSSFLLVSMNYFLECVSLH